MALPDYTYFMHPVLLTMSRLGGTVTRRNLYRVFERNEVPEMSLTEADLREVLPSGGSKLKDRIGWGLDRLLRCGFVERVARATYAVTVAGEKVLTEHPKGLPDDLRIQWSRTNTSVRLGTDSTDLSSLDEPSGPVHDFPTTEDLLGDVLYSLRIDLTQELQVLVGEMEDTAFERLVLVVLHTLGYGDGETPAEPTQRSSDGGIDGIISLDRLGIQKVYVQAKRWPGTVGRPKLQEFVGALGPHRSGVFITTSGYSKEAREYAAQYDGRLVLIDGGQFVKLMIDAGVGVQIQKKITLYRVDNDFFEEF